MRAELLHVWPDLAHLFHLKPWDLYDLTPLELDAFLDARDAYLKQG